MLRNEKTGLRRLIVHPLDVLSITEEFDVVLTIAAFTLAMDFLVRNITLQLEAVEGFCAVHNAFRAGMFVGGITAFHILPAIWSYEARGAAFGV